MSIQNLKIKQVAIITLIFSFCFGIVICPLFSQAFFGDYEIWDRHMDALDSYDSYIDNHIDSMVGQMEKQATDRAMDTYLNPMIKQMENNAINAILNPTTDNMGSGSIYHVIDKAKEQSGKYYFWIRKPDGKLARMKSIKSDGSFTEKRAKVYAESKGYGFLSGQYGSYPKKPIISQDESTIPTTPTQTFCHTKHLWSWNYCSPNCKCAAGEGDCDTDADCAEGLYCAEDVGTQYGQVSLMDVCEKKQKQPTTPGIGIKKESNQIENYQTENGKYYYWIQRPDEKLAKMRSKKSDGSYTEENAKAYADKNGYIFMIGQYGSYPEKPVLSKSEPKFSISIPEIKSFTTLFPCAGINCSTCYYCVNGKCVSRADGYNDCGTGCQRCVSGQCQDYVKGCFSPFDSCVKDQCITKLSPLPLPLPLPEINTFQQLEYPTIRIVKCSDPYTQESFNIEISSDFKISAEDLCWNRFANKYHSFSFCDKIKNYDLRDTCRRSVTISKFPSSSVYYPKNYGSISPFF